MLVIHANTMYNADISIEEKNGVYNLIDTEQAILFSSAKIAHVNKALQYATEQDANGNGILVDQIAPAVFGTSVVFNDDVYGKNAEELRTLLAERGLKPIFISEQNTADIEVIRLQEEENETTYARDIEERFAIGFTSENIPDGYQTMDYADLSDYLGIETLMPELKQNGVSKEKTARNEQEKSTAKDLDFDKEDKKKFIIETREKTIATDSISMSNKPSRKGFYYLNDENGNGFFKSQDKEVLAAILEHIKDKQSAGEIIRIQELRKIERQLSAKTKDTSVEKEFEDLQKSVKHIKNLEKELEKEKSKAKEQLDALKKNKAPQEFIKKAESICNFADESVKRTKDIPSNDETKKLKDDAKERATENAYVTYRLHNTLLTRVNSALKAGFMTAYVNFMEPLRKLSDLSMTVEVKNIAKDNLKQQHKISQINKKLEPKMGKRLEKENRTRRKNGLRELPEGTRLYTPKEQQKINEIQLIITANNRRSQLLQDEIIRTREELQNRLDYIKGHTEIARNEKIVDKQKKVWTPNETPDITNPAPTPSPASEETKEAVKASEIHPQEEFPPMPPIPPMEYDEAFAYAPEEPLPLEPATPAFAPINKRFADAKKEAEAEKIERNAKFVYHAISTKLPANGYIEFDVNGTSYSAEKNEFGDFTMKKYSYETGRNEKISAKEAIEEFKTAPKAFENTIREHLGGVLINDKQNMKQTSMDAPGGK